MSDAVTVYYYQLLRSVGLFLLALQLDVYLYNSKGVAVNNQLVAGCCYCWLLRLCCLCRLLSYGIDAGCWLLAARTHTVL